MAGTVYRILLSASVFATALVLLIPTAMFPICELHGMRVAAMVKEPVSIPYRCLWTTYGVAALAVSMLASELLAARSRSWAVRANLLALVPLMGTSIAALAAIGFCPWPWMPCNETKPPLIIASLAAAAAGAGAAWSARQLGRVGEAQVAA